jgi:hypothetical protein
MSNIKKYLIVVIGVFVLIGVSMGAYAHYATKTPEGWRAYTDARLDYAVMYPEGWAIYDGGSYLSPLTPDQMLTDYPVAISFWQLGAGHFSGMDVFNNVVWNDLMTIKKANPQVVVSARSVEGDLPITQVVFEKIRNRPLQPEYATDRIQASDGDLSIYWISTGERTLRIDCLYPTTKSAAYEPIIQEILATLSISHATGSERPLQSFAEDAGALQPYFTTTPPPGSMSPRRDSIPEDLELVDAVFTKDKMYYEYTHEHGGGLVIFEDNGLSFNEEQAKYDPKDIYEYITIGEDTGFLVARFDDADPNKIVGLTALLDRKGHLFQMSISGSEGSTLMNPATFIKTLQTFSR